MKVLSYGKSFFIGDTPIKLYAGPHDVRILGGHAEFSPKYDFLHDPVHDSIEDILDKRLGGWMPDLILCWFPEDYPPPIGIEDSPVPTLATASDWNLHYPKLVTNLARYDAVLSDRTGADILKTNWLHPTHPFPLYSPCTPHHHPYPEEKDIDVVFVGGFNHFVRPERAHFLERLARLSNQYRIVIATGHEGERYGRLLSRARIVFNHGVRGEANLRLFETLACGSLAFIEEGNQGATRWFEDGRDLVMFNADNFEEKIHYYLAHPDEADAIAARGLARAPEFAGENRLTELIEYGAAHLSSGRRFHELSPVEQDFQTLLMLRFSSLRACQAREKDLMQRLVQEHPDDPRAWAGMGFYIINPLLAIGNTDTRKGVAMRAFTQASELAPDSAPRALSAAWTCQWYEMAEEETRYLYTALDASGLDGAEEIAGDYIGAFWLRWRMALAKKKATLSMLHAQAHVRLATLEGQQGKHAEAESHVVQAAELDPLNYDGTRTMAEAQWASGRRDEAIHTLQCNMTRNPFTLDYRIRLCEMLLHAGRVEQSDRLTAETQRLFKACSLGPDYTEQ